MVATEHSHEGLALSADELAAIRRRLAALGKGEDELMGKLLTGGPRGGLEDVRDRWELRYLVSVLDRWERKAKNSRRARAIP